MTGTVICASKNQRKLWMVQNGRILITLDARFGRPSMPTAEGVHSVYWKDKNHISSSYGSPMPYSMFFYKGQAIHYSSDFSRNGWNGASHGCINIRNMTGLKWLWDHTPTGRKIIVFK
ncbi:L,D-transpeptidase [Cutibacterium sp. WCA-380-WT-3A]|uniref:L,D-transpeptidase n=1 Tax=Cutibacterium porci TaxID=2605781 RepID=A0A7K0J8F0_9ACTN|nr:L,D-transpeptidase [Cutibacterium porci]MSS46236.1 L,D-transpeptidase [Cutibacterium porci]